MLSVPLGSGLDRLTSTRVEAIHGYEVRLGLGCDQGARDRWRRPGANPPLRRD